MLQELYKYMVDNALRVQSRVISFNSPAVSGTVLGNGQIVRLTKDRYNFDIESGHIDSKRAMCISDFQTGTDRGRELFQFKGGSAAKDELQRSGSGAEVLIAGLTTDDSMLDNSHWASFGGTAAAPTSITSWTSTNTVSSSIHTFDSTNNFRPAPSEQGGTSYSIIFEASNTLSQRLSVTGQKMRDDVPYLVAVVWNAAINSGVGTLLLRMGSITTSVTVSGQAGWNVTLVPNPIGQSAWYRNMAQDDLQISIEWVRTSGKINIAEVLLVPASQFDASWYWILPASTATYAPWRVRDTLIWGDNGSEYSSKNQKWIVRGWDFDLPSSNGSSITWADA